MISKKQVVLVVLDGWGYRKEVEHNAIAEAKKPNFDMLWNKYPHTLLQASGSAVGLPEGEIGNSEVGHQTIGAGKIIDSDLVRINKAIESGEFQKNPAFLKLFEHVKKNNSTLHIMGLVSDGGVHSHISHLFAFLKLAKENDVKNIAVHCFTDGRDTPTQSGARFVRDLEKLLIELSVGYISSVTGRYDALDRDHNWDRLAHFEKVLFECTGNISNLKPSDYIESQYTEGKTDEMLEPVIFETESRKCKSLGQNDGAFFFDFRPDRARMLSQKIIEKTAKPSQDSVARSTEGGFREKENVLFVTMTDYEDDFKCLVAFPPIKNLVTLGSVISDAGLSQVRIAETEKFAHATYFLNCGRETPYTGEQDFLIPSSKDATFDLAPNMKAKEIANKAIEEIEKGINFIFINFANADMVGHTGNEQATISAIEEIDRQLGRLFTVLESSGGVMFITADHGNAEMNTYKSGERHTSHTTSPVPAILTDTQYILQDGEGLSNVAPSVLQLLGLQKPIEMIASSLIVDN